MGVAALSRLRVATSGDAPPRSNPTGGYRNEMKLNITATIHIHHHEPSTAALDAIASFERKMIHMFAKESEFIAALNDSTNLLATRVQALLDAAKDRPLTPAEQEAGQAIIDHLNAIGTVAADPIPEVPPETAVTP
jgi:hypothetical protein